MNGTPADRAASLHAIEAEIGRLRDEAARLRAQAAMSGSNPFTDPEAPDPQAHTPEPHDPEHAARETTEQLVRIIDALPILIAIVGADQRYEFVNRQYEVWFGRTRDRILGHSVREVVGNDAYEARREQIERALAGETVSHDGWLPAEDGHRRESHILYIPRRAADGTVTGFYVQVTDIAERNRAAAQARQATERIQLALDAGAISGTWVWDAAADRFTADARFSRTFSVDPAALEEGVPLAQVAQSIHPDDMPQIQLRVAAALAAGGPYSAQYRVRQLDGSYRWIEANGHVTQDAQGRPLSFPGVLIDIHARKMAELRQESLLRLGDRLRELDDADAIAFAAAGIVGTTLDVLRAGYGVIDPTQTWVDMKPNWLATPENSPETAPETAGVTGHHRFADYGSFVENLKRGEVVAIPDTARDPRTAPGIDALRRLGIAALLNVPIMHENRMVAVFFAHQSEPRGWSDDEIAFVRGVADRTWAAMTKAAAARALQELNDTLERRVQTAVAQRDRLWQTSRDLIVVIGRDGMPRAVNPAWMRAFGHADSDAADARAEHFVHPDDRDAFRRACERPDGATGTTGVEVRMRARDGAYRRIDWTVAAVEDGCYATGRDVTEQRKVEEQLRQSQKMEAVGQLTGGMAHDFNNLLQAVSSCLQLVGRRAGHVEGLERVLEAGRQAVDRGASMIRQLMAFSRRQSLQPEPFDVRDRLLGMRVLLDRALRADIPLEFELQAGLWPAMADPVQFELAVLNLATNARDAMDDGGRVVIGAGNVDLLGEEGLTGSFVEVWVRDGGHGIAPDLLHRVFDPFFTTKAVGKGTGLGLAQVYGFCRQSGGTATIKSREGGGTTVSLLLPRAVVSAVAAGSGGRGHARDARLAGGDARVLMVEDDPVVAPVVTAALEELGYSVRRASSGDEALGLLERGEAVDLLFTDVVMPGALNGIALARAARRMLPGLPVVLTTGYSEDRAGLEGFPVLSKPYRIEELADVVRAGLEGRGPGVPAGRER